MIDVSERTRSGWSIAISWAIMPPIDMPTTWALVDAERVEQADRIVGHVARAVYSERSRRRSITALASSRFGRRDAGELGRQAAVAVVERDHPEPAGDELVDEPLRPVDQLPTQPHHQQQRFALTLLVVLDRDPVRLHQRHDAKCYPWVTRDVPVSIRPTIMTMAALPVLDIAGFLAGSDTEAGAQFVRELRDTLHGPGFCYLVGYGIEAKAEAAVMGVANEFFARPEADRLAIVNTNTPHFRGYTRLGMEHTNGVSDWRDQIDIGPEHQPIEIGPDDPVWLRVRGPNQWPPSVPDMEPTMTAWMDQHGGRRRCGVAGDRARARSTRALLRPDAHLRTPRCWSRSSAIRPRTSPPTPAKVSGCTTTRGSCRSSSRTTWEGSRCRSATAWSTPRRCPARS